MAFRFGVVATMLRSVEARLYRTTHSGHFLGGAVGTRSPIFSTDMSFHPSKKICSVHSALLAFKMVKGIIPPDIAFPITAVVKRTTRRETVFERPFARKESTRHSLAYRLPVLWSSLQCAIRSLTSAKKFVREVNNLDNLTLVSMYTL